MERWKLTLILPGVLVLAAAVRAEVPAIEDPRSVAPGTRGTCVTEMPGGELLEFPVTVLGHQGGATPGGELVLVRLEDPRFADTGIVAGMSGSPVYVDGRLLGAVAYGWAFSREPIAGVTPFARMVELAEGRGGASPVSGRPGIAEMLASWRDGTLGESLLEWLMPARPSGARGLLALSLGAGPAGGWVDEGLRRLGLAASGGADRDPAMPAGSLRPGSMVAAVLVDGDAVVSAGGTVTEVRGDQVWAFGHPFLGAGATNLPLAAARVTAVLPSLNSSFKFFSVGPEIGALRVDRARGVWGRLGETAPMVPVLVEADGRSYRFRAVPDRSLLPLLVAYLTDVSVTAGGRSFGEQTLAFSVDLRFAGGRSVAFSEALSRPDAPAQAASMAAAVVGYLGASPFSPPPLREIRISLASREEVRRTELVEAVPSRTVVRPGQELAVRLRLRRFGRGEAWRTERIRIPGNLRPGPLDLVVGDGAAWTLYDLKARPFRPASFEDDLRLLGRLLPSTSLVLVLERKESSLVLDGGTVAAPPSVVLSLEAGSSSQVPTATHRVVERRVLDLGEPVTGAVRVRLRVTVDGGGGGTPEMEEDGT